MTDKTDIAALERPVRDRYDWSLAVWRECDQCGKDHTGTVIAEDGSQICAHCADQIYWSAWQVLAERVLDQLKAERHRADQRLKESAARNRKLRARMRSAEAEIAVLAAKLANPNVLPVGEIVAWSGTDIEKGITREVDFRFLRFDVQPGTQLFTAQQKPVVLRQIGSIDHDGGEYGEYFVEFTDSASIGQAVYVIDSAIEAAGNDKVGE